MKKILTIAGTILFLVFACKDKYNPPLSGEAARLLVVEGIVMGGAPAPTTIFLSRLANFSDSTPRPLERNATIQLTTGNGGNYPFREAAPGVYQTDTLTIPIGTICQLHITTADGKEYASDEVEMLPATNIDEINYLRKNQDVHFYVNAHGEANEPRYYFWKFESTYEYNSQYFLFKKFITADCTMVNRSTEEANLYYRCWKSDPQTTIAVASSAGLSDNVIYQAPLHEIPYSDIRMDVGYSMLLKQYAISETAYAYWSNLRKITEELGGIFGPLPSEVKGNLHCLTNPEEAVIGFVSASSEKEKRQFFYRPPDWQYFFNCGLPDSANNMNTMLKPKLYTLFGPKGGWPVYFNNNPYDTPGVMYSRMCIQCDLRGGSNIKPPFWP
ncbi:DUF4249 domain-containing protein [Flavihumibacter petaseus]|uniref:DUF4249 domain-containing protein n=1 Tax=Flavihumibacter petaseus NBRC 106054 TaxID=1220578 RepID=A0A0E9MZN9_9BACT|nr:DUF4249 domain-containing protein [Flavihumibacter petaseus]GAO42993.1 hypothetical protein FPE01S_02_00980 [Flavihumibacter petaseus NBRC 106054]